MPDAMDQVQAFNDDHTADALQRHADRPKRVGLTHCAIGDCREPIMDARRELGAQLCLACQHEEEARAAHINKWKQR
jgi:hypothetical protein